jgi:transposase InsO family protein
MNNARVLTDNGMAYADWILGLRKRAPTGQHQFDQLCANLGIVHRLTPPMRPETNGMIERLTGRIEDLLQSHGVQIDDELEQNILRYIMLYNQ